MSPKWFPVVAALLVVPAAAGAGILVPREPGGPPLKVRKSIVQVEVRDQVARAVVDEVFENTTDVALEGHYLLPLPEGAAVSGFAVWVDGQRVDSRVEEKGRAEKTYSDAKGERAQPALLEQTDANTFRTKVDGIPAHGTKRVEAQFAQVLPYDGGLVTLRVPLGTTGQRGWEPVDDFRFALELSDQKKITEVKITSHPDAKVTQTKAGWRVTLDARSLTPKDDLVVTYRTESSRLGLSFVPFRPDAEGDGYFLLLASPQELTTAADIVQKDVVFVFDTSGSMSGEKIDQARAALVRCLANLNATDRFGIVAFSDAMNPFRNKLVAATPELVKEATAFASGLGPGGGTNIAGALNAGLQLFEGPRPRVLVFMTDGQPSTGETNWARILEGVKARNGESARVFPFGVGSDVNRTALERLAVENRGGHDFVGSGENIERVIGGFYAKIARPVLSDLAFDFGDVTVAMQYPDVLPDLYKGSQLVVTGRYRGHGKAKASLAGMLNGKKHVIPFEAEFPAQEQTNAFVARIWAQRRIDHLLAEQRLHGDREEARAEVIALATSYQIVTPYTSLVAVRTQPQQLAMVTPGRVAPGDPVITVRAPRDARAVRITLPWGETKRAKWDAAREVWTARFLVPADARDGAYPIALEIEHADGRREELALHIEVDTAAPALAATADPVRAGEVATVRAEAVIGIGELAQHLLGFDAPWLRTKQAFDVRRVSARLWDGREVELALEPGRRGFSAPIETDTTLAPGRYPVTLVARDFAGNASETQVALEVR